MKDEPELVQLINRRLMLKLCKEHNIRLFDAAHHDWSKDEDGLPEYYVNDCASTGDDTMAGEIMMGAYEQPDRKLIDFFHMLGFVMMGIEKITPTLQETKYRHYPDALAWKRGFELAQEQGITFDADDIDWVKERFSAGFKDGHAEWSPAKYLDDALSLAFGVAA